MKNKDGALACAIAYIALRAIPWQSAECLWLFYILLVYACWEMILRVEQFIRWAKRKLLKMKNARGAATPDRAKLKINFK